MDTPLLAAAIPAGPVTPAVPTQPSLMPAAPPSAPPSDIPVSPLATAPSASALTAPVATPLVKPKNPTFGEKLHAALLHNPLTFKNPLANVAVAGIDALSGATSALSNVAAPADSGAGVLAQTAKNIEANKAAKAKAAADAQRQAMLDASKAARDAHLNALTTAQTFSAYATAQRLGEQEQRAVVKDGQKAGAAYATTHDKINSEPITDLNAAIANKIYDPSKMVAYPSGLTSVPDSKGIPQEVVTYDLYKADDRPVPITPEVRAFMKEFGQDPGDVTEIPGAAFNNLQAQASQASAAQKLLFSMKDDSMTQALKLEKDQGSLQFNQDTALVNPYLAAHVHEYGNDPISAMAHLSTQIDPTTGQPTPQAAAAQRIMRGPVGEKDQVAWQKLLETHRHDLADEAAAQEKNREDLYLKEHPSGSSIDGNPNLTGPAYLASLPIATRALVAQIGEGRVPIDRISYLASRPNGEALLTEVALAYPGQFDASKAQAYPALYKDFTTGKVSDQLNAGATALKHLKELQELNNSISRIGETAAHNAFENKLQTLTGELVKFYGQPQTDVTYKQMQETLGAMFNRNAAIESQAESMADKIASYHEQWTNGAPSKLYEAPMPGIDNQAKMALNSLVPDFGQKYPALAGQFLPAGTPAPKSSPVIPPGATQTAPGSDGKMHYTNAQGQDLGVVK